MTRARCTSPGAYGTTAEITAVGSIFDSDPLFANPDGHDNIPGTLDDDFHLTSGSPAIDTGNMAMLPPDVYDLDRDGDHEETIPVDLDFNARVHEGGLEPGYSQVDLGPFEYDAPPVIIANEYVRSVPQNSPRLQGNYPNPFNPSTTITYSLPRPADVRLEVFDLLGKRLRVLEKGFKPAGEHEVTFDAGGLPSGLYFYTLTADNFTQTRKMVVVK